MYWKDGKGANPGSWHGPAKVLMLEGQNLVWISHLTKLFRCAPEHVRPLSQNEAGAVTDSNQGLYQLPERSGNGVFQFRELSSQTGPMPEQLPRPGNQLRHEPEIVINNPIFQTLKRPILITYQIHHHRPPHNQMMNLQYHPPQLRMILQLLHQFLMMLMMI